MTIFETASGSKYELDTLNKRVRRIEGTHRQDSDGLWQRFRECTTPKLGDVMFFFWHKSSPAPMTRTTAVVNIND